MAYCQREDTSKRADGLSEHAELAQRPLACVNEPSAHVERSAGLDAMSRPRTKIWKTACNEGDAKAREMAQTTQETGVEHGPCTAPPRHVQVLAPLPEDLVKVMAYVGCDIAHALDEQGFDAFFAARPRHSGREC